MITLNLKDIEKTPNVHISYDEEKNLMVHRWTDPAGKMQLDGNIFKKNAELVTKNQLELCPRIVLVDTSKLDVTFTVNLHQWGGEQIAYAMVNGNSKRLAFIESSDMFTVVSVEQLVENSQHPDFVTDFFTDEQSALEWLMKEG